MFTNRIIVSAAAAFAVMLAMQVLAQTALAQIAPDQTAPDQAAPDQTAPDQTAPKKTAPKKAAPKKTAPAQTAPAQTTPAQTVDLIDKQDNWTLYADNATPKTVCFIAAQPQAVEPLGANRGPIFFYISAWPKDGVRTEPSIKVGYPLHATKEMTVAVGTDTFKLFAKGERGFVSDATEEQKFVDALKKASTAIVKATSAKGTATTDTYSLSGLNKALEKMAETCP